MPTRASLLPIILGTLFMSSLSSAGAQGLGLKGIGGRVGFVTAAENVEDLIWGMHMNLGEIIENLVLFPSLDYWSEAGNREDPRPVFKWMSINGNLRYYFPAKTVQFYAGEEIQTVAGKPKTSTSTSQP